MERAAKKESLQILQKEQKMIVIIKKKDKKKNRKNVKIIDNNTEHIQINTVDVEIRQNQDNMRIRQMDIQNYVQK